MWLVADVVSYRKEKKQQNARMKTCLNEQNVRVNIFHVVFCVSIIAGPEILVSLKKHDANPAATTAATTQSGTQASRLQAASCLCSFGVFVCVCLSCNGKPPAVRLDPNPPPSLSAAATCVFLLRWRHNGHLVWADDWLPLFFEKRNIERDGRLLRCRLEPMSRLLRASDSRR